MNEIQTKLPAAMVKKTNKKTAKILKFIVY